MREKFYMRLPGGVWNDVTDSPAATSQLQHQRIIAEEVNIHQVHAQLQNGELFYETDLGFDTYEFKGPADET